MKKPLLMVVIVFFGISFAACHGTGSLHGSGNSNSSASTTQPNLPPGQIRVSKQEFGDAWPLTVDEGILSCTGSSRMGEVVLIVNGKKYAVNGVAMSQKVNGQKAYADVIEIQANDPKIPGVKKSVGPLIDRGLKLCQ